MFAGLFAIVYGLTLLGVGLIKTASLKRNAEREAMLHGGPSKRRLVLLLWSNVLVAVTLTAIPVHSSARNTLTVLNASGFELRNFAVLEPAGKVRMLGDISRNQRKEFSFKLEGEGTVKYQMDVSGRRVSGMLFGYVPSVLSSNAILMIAGDKDGTVAVAETDESGQRLFGHEVERVYQPYPCGSASSGTGVSR